LVIIVLPLAILVLGVRQDGENQSGCYQSAHLANAVSKSRENHLNNIGMFA
jgi:hypothetical protein